jgi:hypothetical protein
MYTKVAYTHVSVGAPSQVPEGVELWIKLRERANDLPDIDRYLYTCFLFTDTWPNFPQKYLPAHEIAGWMGAFVKIRGSRGVTFKLHLHSRLQ